MATQEELINLATTLKKEQRKLTKEEKEANVIEYCTFYRRNPDYYNRDILGLKLKPFQDDMIREMFEGDIVDIVASRGLSKTYCTAVASLDFATLFSNQEILITSFTLNQSNELIDTKIDRELSNPSTGQSEFLKQLRRDGYMQIKTDSNTSARYVEFGNGSKIYAAVAGESTRGKRSTIVIVDECVLVKKCDYDQIIEPTLRPRQFLARSNYPDYPEETKQIFLTSAKTKTSWVWTHLKNCVTSRYKGNTKTKYRFYAGDIFTAIASGLQTKRQYEQRKKNSDDLSFQMEYLNCWVSEGENSMFNLKDFESNQVLETPFEVRNVYEVAEGKPNSYNYRDNEIRVVVSDVAMSATSDQNHDNDATVLVFEAINLDTGKKRIENIIPIEGTNAIDQAVQMKRAFYEYKATYFAMDCRGVGLTQCDLLGQPTYDAEYGVQYPAWNINRNKEYSMCSDAVLQEKISRQINNGEEVIIPIVATSQSNHEMHLELRQALKNGEISFLKDPNDMRVVMEQKDPTFITLSSEERANKLVAFVRTRAMINEAISLETKFLDSGLIKLKEARSKRKDMIITVEYSNQLANKIILAHNQEDDTTFDESDWAFIGGDFSEFNSSFGGYSW